MAARRFSVTVGTEEVAKLIEKLGNVDDVAMARGAMQAVNTVAAKTYEDAKGRMLRGINLTEQYVEERMHVDLQKSPSRLAQASITGRRRHTGLARFGSKQMMQQNKWPTPPYPRTGDKSRGIPVGMKQAGVSVEVIRGVRKAMPGAFLVPLMRGRSLGGNVGLFTRTGNGPRDLKMRTGPSVYQLFRTAIDGMYDDITANLREETEIATRKEIEEALR